VGITSAFGNPAVSRLSRNHTAARSMSGLAAVPAPGPQLIEPLEGHRHLALGVLTQQARQANVGVFVHAEPLSVNGVTEAGSKPRFCNQDSVQLYSRCKFEQTLVPVLSHSSTLTSTLTPPNSSGDITAS